jgi:hypothetical protein
MSEMTIAAIFSIISIALAFGQGLLSQQISGFSPLLGFY